MFAHFVLNCSGCTGGRVYREGGGVMVFIRRVWFFEEVRWSSEFFEAMELAWRN